MNQLDFKGRTAVVTGGATGIGAAIVRRLEVSGAKVAVWDLTGPDRVDVADEASIGAALKRTLASLGRIDVLVNNAGIAGPSMPVVDYPVADWRKVIDIDLNGPFLCSRVVVPHMVKQKYGRIVNIASVAGKEGNPNAAAYAAAKGGLIAFTKALGKELAQSGVLVNCVTPAAAPDGDPRPGHPGVREVHAVEDPDGALRQGGGDRCAGLLAGVRRLLVQHGRGIRHFRRKGDVLT